MARAGCWRGELPRSTNGRQSQAQRENQKLKDQLRKAREAAKEEGEIRIRVQEAHESDARQWEGAAETLRRTIRELHEKYAPPRDLERLRVQIMDELEQPHAEKVALMEGDLEEVRKQLFAARRRAEALRVSAQRSAGEGGARSLLVDRRRSSRRRQRPTRQRLRRERRPTGERWQNCRPR